MHIVPPHGRLWRHVLCGGVVLRIAVIRAALAVQLAVLLASCVRRSRGAEVGTPSVGALAGACASAGPLAAFQAAGYVFWRLGESEGGSVERL